MILNVEFDLRPALLQMEFEEDPLTLDVSFCSDEEFNVDFGEIQRIAAEDIPVYDGEYEVTPTPEGQTLETAGLLMEKDTTIRAIPVYEVSNTAGGTTVYIGTEI